ncbi:MAG: protein kinase domain-containing protein [Thermogutta sp.]
MMSHSTPPSRDTASSTHNGGASRHRLDDQPTVITGGDQALVGSTAELGVEIVAPKLSPGAMIGPYELLDQIGGGGMGRVFRAFEASVGRTVALKLLSPNQAADPQTLARFQNEARAAGRLNHPNIVQVFSAGEVQGIPFIALEFIEGKNARALVEENGGLPVGDVVRYAIQVAEALEHAWSRGVVHRDVKPSNILVLPDGRVKLIDFGLARMNEVTGRSRDLTSSGMTLGTFDYIAPEQARDPRLADIRSDIYSLGCTLFFMLTGRPPFPKGTVLQKLLQHQAEEPPDVRKLRKDVPEALGRVLRRMMAKSPRQRYQTAAQLIQALSEVLAEISQHYAAARVWGTPESKAHRVWRKHLPWLVPVLLFLSGTVALDWWWSPATLQGLPGGEIYDLPLQPNRELSPGSPAKETPAKSGDGRDRPLGSGGPGAGRAALSARAPWPGDGEALPVESGDGWNAPAGILTKRGTADQQEKRSPLEMANRLGVVLPAESSTNLGKDGLFGSSQAIASPLISSDAEPVGQGASLPGTWLPGLSGNVLNSPPMLPSPLQPGSGAEQHSVAGTPADRAGAIPALPGGSATVPTPAPPANGPARGVLIVDPIGRSPGRFPTLGTALAVAQAGDTIRLDFDGPLEVEPCDVRGRNLIIAAAEGRRPELVLRPTLGTLSLRQKTFFAAAGAALTFRDVALLAKNVSSVWPDGWSVFHLDFGSQVVLDRCVVTVAEKSWSDQDGTPAGRVLEVRSDPQSYVLLTGGLPSPNIAARPVGIALTDCVLRGETSAVWVGAGQPVSVSLKNCLTSTSGRLLEARGSDMPLAKEFAARLTAENVTCAVRSEAIRVIPGEYRPYVPQVEIEARVSIWVGPPQGILVEHVGMSAEEALGKFRWRGDRNFYERFAVFWSIAPGTGTETLRLPFDAWRNYWRWENETSPAWGAVPWSRPLPDGAPPHQHNPRDFSLMDPLIDDAAIGLAGEVGCLADRLPAVTSGETTSGP